MAISKVKSKNSAEGDTFWEKQRNIGILIEHIVMRDEWILNRDVEEDTIGGAEIRRMCDKMWSECTFCLYVV